MAKDDSGAGAAIAVAAGVAAALIGAYLLTHTKCPVCGRTIRKGIDQCPHCYSSLNWS